MTKNTAEDALSSPQGMPAFMMPAKADETAPEGEAVPLSEEEADIAQKRAKAERVAARESAAQDKDAFDIRTAALDKATTRLVEMASYLEKIADVSGKVLPTFIGVHPLGQVLDRTVAFEDAAQLVEAKLKVLLGQITFTREVALPTRMDDEEQQTCTSSETGHRMSRTARVFASILPGLTDNAFKWLRDNNYGSLIKETVNSSSLSGAAKELLANGKELPDDTFRTHTKDGVSITRKKAKA